MRLKIGIPLASLTGIDLHFLGEVDINKIIEELKDKNLKLET